MNKTDKVSDFMEPILEGRGRQKIRLIIKIDRMSDAMEKSRAEQEG